MQFANYKPNKMMKYNPMKTLIAGAALLLAVTTYSQSLSIDKVHPVSKKVSGFSVIDLSVDEAADDVSVTYFTKSQKDFFGDPKKLTFETYHFDLNYEFKNVEEEIIDIVKSQSKYKGFKFKGDEYKEIGISMGLAAKVTFVKKETSYKWNWYTNAGYYKKVKTLEKLKLADAGYGELYKVFSSEGDSTLNAIAQSGGEGGAPKYHFMTVDRDMNIFNESQLQLKYHVAANIKEFEREDGYKDIFMMLQPTDFKGAVTASSATSFKLLQIDGKTMKVTRNIDFESPGTAFYMENITLDGNDLYIVGKVQNKVGSMELSNYIYPKFTEKTANLMIVKVSGNSLAYVKSMNSEQLTGKMSVIPGVKGKPAVTPFLLFSSLTVSNGDLFINAQNYKLDKAGIPQKRDAVMLQLSSNGELKKSFIYPFEGELDSKIFMSADGKNAYWTVLDFQSKEKKGIVYKYPPIVNVSKIDLTSGTPGALKLMGGEDAKLYYDFPLVPTSDPNSVTFYGSKGKGTIWFGKMQLD